MDLSVKKVCVFGMGKSGISSLKLLKKKGAKEVWAVSQGDPDSWGAINEIVSIVGRKRCVAQREASELMAVSDLVILSPGIPREHEVLKSTHEKEIPVWSEIELAFRYLKSEKIIAVTGTNGKTTVVTMMGQMLENLGKTMFVGGNIGVPLADYVISDKKCEYVVLELSSFQLESMPTFRSDVSIILNIFPNHGERYRSVCDYAKAKFNLTKNAKKNDTLIYPENFGEIKNWAKKQLCNQIAVDTGKLAEIKSEIQDKYTLADFKLPGTYNITNLFFILKTMEVFGLGGDGIQKTINEFSGVRYRAQFLPSNDPFIVYNDAKSTNWDATLAAVYSMDKGDRELFLICGGQKRTDCDSILEIVPRLQGLVDCVLLIGETTGHFASELDEKINFQKCHTLENAVDWVRKNGFSGILLFSPAFPSFDQFENYVKRGERFEEIIRSQS